MNKVVFAIRTHKLDHQTIRIYKSFAEEFGEESIYIVCDATRNSIDNVSCAIDSGRIIKFDSSVLECMQLYHRHPKIGWLCGDYFYYVLASRVNADYYWLVEPDVYFTFAGLSDFFNLYLEYDDDFLAPFYGARKKAWGWHQHAAQAFGNVNVYGCAFPITRMSKAVVDHLYVLRREHATRSLVTQQWPNDESFVSTAINSSIFIASDLRKIMPNAFDYFNVHYPYLLGNKFTSIIPGNMVVHPVLDADNFESAVYRKLMAAIRRSNIKEALRSLRITASDEQWARIKAISIKAFGNYIDSVA